MYTSVRAFFVQTAKYLLQWCPFSDELIKRATWIDFRQRLSLSFTSVEFFVGTYSEILNDTDMDKLNEQFIQCQTFNEHDIPESVKDLCGLSDKEEKIHQVDVLWDI